jgi:hypothetical protein
MKTNIAFCSACDREVRIVTTDDPPHDSQANVHDAEIVCLEIGKSCTGSLCPIGATTPAVMAARLVRNGLQATVHPLVSRTCERCDRVTTHVLIERHFATCSECGATVEHTFELDI